MTTSPRHVVLLASVFVAALGAPAVARATDTPDVVVVEQAPQEETEVVETVEVVHKDEHHHRHADEQPWFGVHVGAVTSPVGPNGQVRPGKRVTSNPFKACLDPFQERYCSAMRGFDLRVQYYETTDAWHYPRWVGYFRTGYSAGRAQFDPQESEGYGPGEARSLAYYAVPLFFGGSVYLFEKFPVRPYGGLGFGFDIVKLQYMRQEDRSLIDASARIGFELHAGIEGRISNVVAITAEVQQLWSARRKLAEVPDFSNTGLTIMTGIAISIPSRRQASHDHHGHHHGHRHEVVRRVERKRPAPASSPPAVVVAAPAPTPAPVTTTAPVHVNVNQTVHATPTSETTQTAPVAPPVAPPAQSGAVEAAAVEAAAAAEAAAVGASADAAAPK